MYIYIYILAQTLNDRRHARLARTLAIIMSDAKSMRYVFIEFYLGTLYIIILCTHSSFVSTGLNRGRRRAVVVMCRHESFFTRFKNDV